MLADFLQCLAARGTQNAAWRTPDSRVRPDLPTSHPRQPLPNWYRRDPAAQAMPLCDEPIHPVAPSWAVCVSALASCRPMDPILHPSFGILALHVVAGCGDDICASPSPPLVAARMRHDQCTLNMDNQDADFPLGQTRCPSSMRCQSSRHQQV